MEFRAGYNAKIENMPQLPYAVEEAINRLRVNVSFLGNEVKKIMVISSEPDEGKSFVAMQLWRQMAEAGSKSILVDMDLRKSVMVDKYKIIREDGKHVYGLSEYLAGDDFLEHYILHTDIGEGDILPNVENDITPVDMIRLMAHNPIVFPMANPVPEIMPEEALRGGAAVEGSGRSDYKNQINNVLAFPGIFRGALDCRAKDINEAMKVAASYAIAGLVAEDELSADYIIPKAFDPRVGPAVAKAVAEAARQSGVARI